MYSFFVLYLISTFLQTMNLRVQTKQINKPINYRSKNQTRNKYEKQKKKQNNKQTKTKKAQSILFAAIHSQGNGHMDEIDSLKSLFSKTEFIYS